MKVEAISQDRESSVELHDMQVNELARFLFEGVGLNKNMIGEFLGGDKPLPIRANKAFF